MPVRVRAPRRTLSRRELLSALGGGLAVAGGVTAAPRRAAAAGLPSDLASRELGASMNVTPPHDDAQAALAKTIGEQVVCLCGTCPKRLIHECDCGWAAQNRNVILNAVVAGRGEAEVVAAYRKAYGDQVLAMLPNEGFAVTAWALPYAVGAVGLVTALAVGLRFLKQSGSGAAAPATPSAVATVTDDAEAKAELERALEDLD
jgi:cytochrome c-type biogenesis protein CcmH/NrfF